MKKKSKNNPCPRCRCIFLNITSASPGDGRRKFECLECEYKWTQGKRETEGYKSWPK